MEIRLLKCPKCDKESPENKWARSEVGCDDCGSHTAAICPECQEAIDQVFHDFNIKWEDYG